MKNRNESFLSPTTTFFASVLLAAMLGVVDWASGYELQFFVFYFIPVSVGSWVCGSKRGYIIGIFSAGFWFAADMFSGHIYTHISFSFWNTAIRLIAFLVLAFAIARIRSLLEKERDISDELERTLSEMKILTGLLPICSVCKKIRNDAGYWQKIEDYIEKHSNAQFTHGLCQSCAAKLLEDAGINPDLEQVTPAGSGS